MRRPWEARAVVSSTRSGNLSNGSELSPIISEDDKYNARYRLVFPKFIFGRGIAFGICGDLRIEDVFDMSGTRLLFMSDTLVVR